MKNKAEFKLWISQFDSDVINSYPQKVVSVKNKFFFREVVIQNVSTHEDFELFDFPKEKGEKDYLESTNLVDYENSIIKEAYENLKLSEMSNSEAIKTALSFVKSTVQFDMDLAKQIGRGKSSGRSASKTLQLKKGTCGECVNLFASFMRLKGIPCKFITGFCIDMNGNRHSLHAWAEVFDQNIGWFAVCPQSGLWGVPNFFVKTHQGLDFDDSGANFSKIFFMVKYAKKVE